MGKMLFQWPFRRRPWRVGFWMLGVAVGSTVMVAAPPAVPWVQIYSNGVVVCSAGAFLVGHGLQGVGVRFDFGLPVVAPSRRFWLDEVPILQTEWENGGVRYTQRVLVTRWGEGPLDGLTDDAVLVVQIAGESLVQEYTNATASLAVQAGKEIRPLELRGGWVYQRPGGGDTPLAFLDIPSVGIVTTNGLRLQFQGHMPPANSGAMTLVVPRQPLTAGAVRDRVVDLDFNETLHRVRQFWRSAAAQNIRPPLAWGDAPPAAADGGKGR